MVCVVRTLKPSIKKRSISVGNISNGYNRTCPLPRMATSLRRTVVTVGHPDKSPQGRAHDITIQPIYVSISNSNMNMEKRHDQLINT